MIKIIKKPKQKGTILAEIPVGYLFFCSDGVVWMKTQIWDKHRSLCVSLETGEGEYFSRSDFFMVIKDAKLIL